jgi:hypothetical protein
LPGFRRATVFDSRKCRGAVTAKQASVEEVSHNWCQGLLCHLQQVIRDVVCAWSGFRLSVRNCPFDLVHGYRGNRAFLGVVVADSVRLGWPRGGAGPEKRNRPVGRVLKSGTAPTGPLRKMEPPRGAGPRKWNRPAGRVLLHK